MVKINAPIGEKGIWPAIMRASQGCFSVEIDVHY
jgi:hypothetical protein